MATTYYAVCNAHGPISVRLEGETRGQALAAFAALDTRAAIDSASTDAEDDLEIDGADMSEDEFARALEEAGAERVEDLSPVVNAHAGTVAHLADGWTLWSFSDDSSDFEPNAVITIHRVNGKIERIPVLCEVRDGKIAPGPCYTRDEWRSSNSADWEYDKERGLLWQGQPGGPYNFAEYEIRLGSDSGITDERIKALRTEAAQAGDTAQVRLCDLALEMDTAARAECERVIEAARAARS